MERLTVDRRLLLHLDRFLAYRDAWEVPAEVSQEGIGAALDVLLNNVSRSLAHLEAEGLVLARLCHIKGATRRRRAYFLTDAGQRRATEVRDAFLAEPAALLDRDGKRTDASGAEVLDRLRKEHQLALSASELAEALRANDVLDPARLSTARRGASTTPATPKFVDHAGKAPRLHQFVGRERELRALEEGLKDGGTAVVLGIPGIGKTTLAARILEDYRGSCHTVLLTLTPWSTVRSVGGELAEFLAAAGRTRLGAAIRAGDPPDEGSLLAALERDVSGLTALVVLDDVHRAGGALEPILVVLKEAASRSKVTRVLLLSREPLPFYSRQDVRVSKRVTEVRLVALDEKAAHAMAPGTDDARFAELYAAARGVPLFIELLAGSSPGPGADRRDLDSYLDREVFGRLAPEEHAVLAALAVHRRPVAAEAVLQDRPWAVLDRLVGRSVVTALPDRRFEVHDVVREHLVLRLPKEEKGRLHRLAADHLLRSESASELLEAAFHLEAAGAWSEAAAVLVGIGPDVLETGIGGLLELLEAVPAGATSDETHAQLLLLRADAHAMAGDWSKALPVLEECQRLHEQLKADPALLGEIQGRIGTLQLQSRKVEDAIGSHRASLQLFTTKGDKAGMAKAHLNIGLVERNRRRFQKALENYGAAEELLRSLGDDRGLAVLGNNRALLLEDMGNLPAARDALRGAVEVARRAGGATVGMVLINWGDLLARQGDTAGAVERYTEAADVLERSGRPDHRVEAMVRLGEALAGSGKIDEAIAWLQQALALVEVSGTGGYYQSDPRAEEVHAALARVQGQAAHWTEAARHWVAASGFASAVTRKGRYLFEAALARENDGQDPASASRDVSRAKLLLEEAGDLKGVIATTLLLGRFALTQKRVKPATQYFNEALGIAKKIGDRKAETRAKEGLEAAQRMIHRPGG